MKPEFYCYECGEAVEAEYGSCEECEKASAHVLLPNGLKAAHADKDRS